MRRTKKTEDIPLAPVGEFKKAVKLVLGSTKKESDDQMAAFQAVNASNRAAKKKG